MPPCASIEPKLTQYLFGELPVEDLPQVHEHLEQCGQCQQLFQTLQDTVLAFQAEGDGAGLDEARCQELLARADEVAAQTRRRRLMVPLVIIGAVVVIAAVAAWLVIRATI